MDSGNCPPDCCHPIPAGPHGDNKRDDFHRRHPLGWILKGSTLHFATCHTIIGGPSNGSTYGPQTGWGSLPKVIPSDVRHCYFCRPKIERALAERRRDAVPTDPLDALEAQIEEARGLLETLVKEFQAIAQELRRLREPPQDPTPNHYEF